MYNELLDQGIDPFEEDEPTPEEIEADRVYRAWWDGVHAANALPGESSSDCYRRLEALEDEANRREADCALPSWESGDDEAERRQTKLDMAYLAGM
jgi:hypothetical protein